MKEEGGDAWGHEVSLATVGTENIGRNDPWRAEPYKRWVEWRVYTTAYWVEKVRKECY